MTQTQAQIDELLMRCGDNFTKEILGPNDQHSQIDAPPFNISHLPALIDQLLSEDWDNALGCKTHCLDHLLINLF